jgi:hypothetical protein
METGSRGGGGGFPASEQQRPKVPKLNTKSTGEFNRGCKRELAPRNSPSRKARTAQIQNRQFHGPDSRPVHRGQTSSTLRSALASPDSGGGDSTCVSWWQRAVGSGPRGPAFRTFARLPVSLTRVEGARGHDWRRGKESSQGRHVRSYNDPAKKA